MAAAARKVNWFAIWISVGVVVALVVVGALVVWMNSSSTSTAPGQSPTASNIDTKTGAIIVGDGPDVLDTYIDFMCPICNTFEQSYGPTIAGLVDDGSITQNIHPISILDRASQGTEYSTRAASAMYCVAIADAEASVPFMQAMYSNQPEEGSTGLTDDQILQVAAGVGVTDVDDCVNDGLYMDYVTTMTEKTPVKPDAAGIGTPTVVLNGDFVTLTGDPVADLVTPLQG